ncbi:MAG: helix-turn-helix domain-containing protein [Desulfovibrionaceae bacterium]|nr:helix-turn-helix domain-containing protein [Desulfovibrionaceae bacterium]
MHPELIKAQIRMKGTTPTAIAEALGVSRTAVRLVINGVIRSTRIRAAIVDATGMTERTLWPSQPPSGLRRKRSCHAAQGAAA